MYRAIEEHLDREEARRVTAVHHVDSTPMSVLLALALLPGVPGRTTLTILDGLPPGVAPVAESLGCSSHGLPILRATVIAGCLRVENLPHLDECDDLPEEQSAYFRMPEGHRGDISVCPVGTSGPDPRQPVIVSPLTST